MAEACNTNINDILENFLIVKIIWMFSEDTVFSKRLHYRRFRTLSWHGEKSFLKEYQPRTVVFHGTLVKHLKIQLIPSLE